MLKAQKARRFVCFVLLLFSFLQLPFAGIIAAEESRTQRFKSAFSAQVDKYLGKSAEHLDRSLLKLVSKLNKSNLLSVEVHSHFYDAKIRRYFISLSGKGIFKGRLPFKIKSKQYLLSCEKEVSFDFCISDIQKMRQGTTFNFEGSAVFSLDRIAYRLMQSVPHLAASGALSPAARLLNQFLERINVGYLSDAISETLKDFSVVAVSKTGAELLSAAGNNKELTEIITTAVKDGSVLSFLGLSILRCAVGSVVSVAGASLGSAVGSVLVPVPGLGTVVGAFLGSQILSHIASTAVYYLTVKFPVTRDLKKIAKYYSILKRNPNDLVAFANFEKSNERIERKVFREFNADRFNLFKAVLNRIEKYSKAQKKAFVILLKGFQQNLMFRVINSGDWYFAKFYHQLRLRVEKWGLEKDIIFTTELK